jgi:hypothetical protein
MAAVTAWVARHPGWAARFAVDTLQLVVDVVHPVAQTPIRITADLTGYPAIPPAWQFTNPAGDGPGPFPAAGSGTAVPGSIFHGNKVICAPWNRLAFSELGGPHGDWGGLTNWRTTAVDCTRAETLADVLSQIALHLSVSPGVR